MFVVTINLVGLNYYFLSARGGIVFWADTVGAKHIYTSLQKWSEMYGNFYKPSRFLEERAIKGISLVRPLFHLTLSPPKLTFNSQTFPFFFFFFLAF